MTPLLRPAEGSGFKALGALPESGAEANAEGHHGNTAQHLVYRFWRRGFERANNLLLQWAAGEMALDDDWQE